MNKVDQVIKGMMLSYPTLFPTRFSALKNIFCGFHTGWSWVDGVPTSESNYYECDKMDLSSYEERVEYSKKRFEDMRTILEKELPEGEDIEKCLDGERFDVIQSEKELADAKFREANIDSLCQEYYGRDEGSVKNFLFDYKGTGGWIIVPDETLIPVEEMDEEWRLALRSFVGKMFPALHGVVTYCNRKTNRHELMEGKEDTELGKLWTMFDRLYKMLETKEDQERESEIMDIVDKVIEDF